MIWTYLHTFGHQTLQSAECLTLTFCKSCRIFPLLIFLGMSIMKLNWHCIWTGSIFLGHLVYVVLQDPVTDPIQSLNQTELRFHIFCLLLFTEKIMCVCTLLSINKNEKVFKCKRHRPGVTVARLYHPMWLLTLGKFTPKLYRHNLWLHFSGNTLQSHLTPEIKPIWGPIQNRRKRSLPCRPHRWKHTSHHTCPPPSLLQVKVSATGQTCRDMRPTSSNNTFLKYFRN